MKYKPKTALKTPNFTERNELFEKSTTTARTTYAEIMKDRKNTSIKTSNTNLNNYYVYWMIIWTPKQGNVLSRNNSNTNMAKDEKCQQETNGLKEKIKLLKQSKKQ